MKRACELCKQTARIHCESDQACLCWDCDAKVHSANFLVARHSRNLLCRLCQSPTPWSAFGSQLEPTFAVCRNCINGRICVKSVEEDAAEMAMDENQVSTPPPPPESSSSSEDAESDGEVVVSNIRCVLENDQCFDDDDDSLSSTMNVRKRPSNSVTEVASIGDYISTPPLKIRRRRGPVVEVGASESGLLDSPRRFHGKRPYPMRKCPNYVR